MPRNFSPADRETVLEEAKTRRWVYEAKPCGRGVIAVTSVLEESTVRGFALLMEEYGWYVDKYVPADDENGDLVVLMPVTEVPE